MKNFFGARCRAQLLAGALCLGYAPCVLAQTVPFSGRWLADDRPQAQAAYTALTIKDGRMSWSAPGGSAPGCVQQFLPKKENPGTVYADGHGTRFVAGVPGSLPTYLLTISASSCGRIGEDVRISFPFVYDTNRIEVIEYVNRKPVGSRRFRRKR
jgi:hypothetical protein